MKYNIWFNCCALILLGMLMLIFYQKYQAPFKKYTIFMALLWFAFISTVTSLINNTLPGIAPNWLLRLSNVTYFLAHSMIPPALVLYAHSLTDYSLRDWRRLIPWLLPAGFGVMLILSSLFSDSLFWLDAGGIYHRGELMPLLYVVTGYHFIVVIYSLMRHSRVIPVGERFTMYLFLAMASTSVLVQMVFPTLLVENFISAVCLMASQMAVQNPEMILDGATGMLNKQGFSSLLSPQIERKQAFQVGFVIVDNYHELERSYGYDRLESKMKILSDYLKNHTGCTFAKMDNRMFCFVLSNFQDSDALEEVLRDLEGDRLNRHLMQERVGIRFRIKFGALSCPEDADSFGGLMELLDVAGKLPQSNEVYARRLNTMDVLTLRRRRQIDKLTRSAVEDQLLSVVYQPIYCGEGRHFCSAEALLRMHTDKLGNVSPAEFIQIAEENGSIVQMTQFVVETVCDLLKNSTLAAHKLSRIHINLSAIDCMQADLAARILETIHRFGIDHTMISVEITETAFSSMPDSILNTLAELSRSGVNIMLDDYGTGYSNLSRLYRMPLDVVKLDKSLVDNIMDSEPARIILNNTILMMKRLNKKILVEGVESQPQADYLWSQGVNYIQGYYYARPMDAHKLEDLFATQDAAECEADCAVV